MYKRQIGKLERFVADWSRENGVVPAKPDVYKRQMEHKVRNLKIAVQTTKQKKMAGRVHSGELPIIVY